MCIVRLKEGLVEPPPKKEVVEFLQGEVVALHGAQIGGV